MTFPGTNIKDMYNHYSLDAEKNPQSNGSVWRLSGSGVLAEENGGNSDAVEKWRQLSPEEQATLKERFETWKSLPPAEKRGPPEKI